jgi:hypothetical protein
MLTNKDQFQMKKQYKRKHLNPFIVEGNKYTGRYILFIFLTKAISQM